MKKALVIFLALALVGSVFAAEPAAEVKVAEFKGDAAVTFGVNLADGETGFKNETSGSLKLNLLNGGDKSTEGDGVWGELQIKFDGIEVAAKADKASALNDKKVSIEVAKIHFGPVYMGIKSGDFDYGGDFLFPNALNWKDDKDDFVKNPAKELKYDQGFVLGYSHDMFSVEASFRSKKVTGEKFDKVESFVAGDKAKAPAGGAWTGASAQWDAMTDNKTSTTSTYVAKDGALTKDATYYKRVMKDGDTVYWTSKYALGAYAEVKPIKDLRVGAGAAYVLGDLHKDPNDAEDLKGDISVFAGFDYRLNVTDMFFLQPVAAYTLYADKTGSAYALTTNNLGMGLRFGFKGSTGGNSLLKDFFGTDMVYNSKKEDDKILLPGVSVYSALDFTKIGKEVPLLVTFYPGELVKGLNAAAFAYAKLGTAFGSEKGADVQSGVAASYDIKVGDITVVPALGALFSYDKVGSTQSFELGTEAKVDVKGLVDNTTFTVAWDKGKYTFGSSQKAENGELTLKAEISF